MDNPIEDRVQKLFEEAVELSEPKRREFLTTACEGNVDLLAEVESLLAADTQAGKMWPDSPAVRSPNTDTFRIGSLSPAESRLKAGVCVESYRIQRPIAEGGMGVVYQAEQDNPRRLVALKIAPHGQTSSAQLERFRREAQILGRLNHHGIAKIYEAGFTEDGVLFIAMEFIRGLRLDAFARARSLSISACLELMARVCDAAQSAHDHNIVHRDLKPANILVEESGLPKILDFGVARMLDTDRLAGDLTQTGQLLGTLAYMSPEQFTGHSVDVDHRADVYALGVTLFELLAHRLPYQLGDVPLADAIERISDQDPPALGVLERELRGDVETIVARAMEKDPARRYQSAAELAADLRRFLNHQPIAARPPSVFYRLNKFRRRHKAIVWGIFSTMMALILGLVGTILFAIGESRQRVKAEDHAREVVVAQREAEDNAQAALTAQREAEDNAQAALTAQHEAQRQAYRAGIAAAVGSISTHDMVDAKRQLDEAPKDLRGWEWRHLYSQLDDSSQTYPVRGGFGVFLLGAPHPLRLAVFTPTGLKLTNLKDGKQWLLPIGPSRGIRMAAAETTAGLRVAVWVGKTIELLDETGTVLCRAELPEVTIQERIVISPDGTRLAAIQKVGTRNRIVIFDAKTGNRLAVCDGHSGLVYSCTFSPDGKRLATASQDTTARLWNAESGELLAKFKGHRDYVMSVAFHPNAERLVTASIDGTVRQWDAETGQEVEPPFAGHRGGVTSAVYSPNGKYVASTGKDNTTRIWRATGLETLAVRHGHARFTNHVAFAPNGRRLASQSHSWVSKPRQRTIAAWDFDPQAPLPKLRGHTRSVQAVAYSSDGRWIASGSSDNTARIWDATTGQSVATFSHPDSVVAIAFSSDNKSLITGNNGDDRLRIWDIKTSRIVKEIQNPGSFRFLTANPNGEELAATVYFEKKFRFDIYDTVLGQKLFSSEGRGLAYSPDGRWLATVAREQNVLLLRDARTREIVHRLDGHRASLMTVAFSPDSQHVVTTSRDGVIRLWHVDSGAHQVLRRDTNIAYAAAFHPHESRLATGGDDGKIWIWNPESGELLAKLPGHTGQINSLAFSPDGATLVSGSVDTTVRLWDAKPLRERHLARSNLEAAQPKAIQ